MTDMLKLTYKIRDRNTHFFGLKSLIEAFGGIIVDWRCIRQWPGYARWRIEFSTEGPEHQALILKALAISGLCLLESPDYFQPPVWYPRKGFSESPETYIEHINSELSGLISGLTKHELLQVLMAADGKREILHLWVLELFSIVIAFPGYIDLIRNNVPSTESYKDVVIVALCQMYRKANIRALRTFLAWLRHYADRYPVFWDPERYTPQVEVASISQWLNKTARDRSVPAAVGAVLLGIELPTILWCDKLLPHLEQRYVMEGCPNPGTVLAWVKDHALLVHQQGSHLGIILKSVCPNEKDYREMMIMAMLGLRYYQKAMDAFMRAYSV